jgi:hypothetical protein
MTDRENADHVGPVRYERPEVVDYGRLTDLTAGMGRHHMHDANFVGDMSQ